MIFSFSHPQYLFFLFVIPLFFLIHFFSLNNRKKLALNFANFEAISRIKGIDFFSKNIVLLLLDLIIVLLMILSVSGLTLNTVAKTSSFSYVLALDASQSMEATDFLPNRLGAAKDTAKKFVDTAPNSVSIGVVSFAGSSYIIQDITKDKAEVSGKLDSIEISNYGGTDIYEAVITSSNMLANSKNRAVVLLSDGQVNVGTVDEIIDYANYNNVLIHTIAMGTERGGATTYGISKLDEEALTALAYNTGGKYFLASDKDTLSESFLDILELTESKVSIKLSDYLIIIAIVIFILEFFLANTRYMNLI